MVRDDRVEVGQRVVVLFLLLEGDGALDQRLGDEWVVRVLVQEARESVDRLFRVMRLGIAVAQAVRGFGPVLGGQIRRAVEHIVRVGRGEIVALLEKRVGLHQVHLIVLGHVVACRREIVRFLDEVGIVRSVEADHSLVARFGGLRRLRVLGQDFIVDGLCLACWPSWRWALAASSMASGCRASVRAGRVSVYSSSNCLYLLYRRADGAARSWRRPGPRRWPRPGWSRG